MTKKSSARIQRDIQAGLRRPTVGAHFVPNLKRAAEQTQAKGLLSQAAAQDQERAAAIAEAAEKVKIWDELNQMHDACLRGILNYTNASHLKSRPEIIASITGETNRRFTDLLITLRKDIGSYQADLEKIGSNHKGKEGSSLEMADLALYTEVLEQYHAFAQQAQSVLGGTYAAILEIFHAAEEAYEKGRADSVTDVDVVTDVAFSEVSS